MAVPPFVSGQVLTAAQMNLGAWQVKTATAAGTATTLQVNNAFSADWRSYRMFITGYTANLSTLTLQLSTGGTVATAANYYWNEVVRNYNAVNSEANSGGAAASFKMGLSNNATTNQSGFIVDVIAPYETIYTQMVSMNSYNNASSRSVVGMHAVNTSYDGFLITSSSGNLTLNVSVYGFVGA